MAIKNRLKVILAEKNMSQNELCEKIKLSKSALSNIINLKQNPTLETAFDIAEAINATVDEIFYKEKTQKETIIDDFKNMIEQMNNITFLYEGNMITRQDMKDIYKAMKKNFQKRYDEPMLIEVCMETCEDALKNLNPLALEILYKE